MDKFNFMTPYLIGYAPLRPHNSCNNSNLVGWNAVIRTWRQRLRAAVYGADRGGRQGALRLLGVEKGREKWEGASGASVTWTHRAFAGGGGQCPALQHLTGREYQKFGVGASPGAGATGDSQPP